MKIARYRLGDREHHGLLEGDRLVRLAGSPFDSLERDGAVDALADATLLCPVDRPRVFAMGMNYLGHIAETHYRTPERPLLFMMPTTAVIGPGEAIVLPREAKVVHHECELTIVIGKRVRRLSRDEALGAVFGYTCANDVSERVIQNEEMAQGSLLVGKSFDTFCPLGPVIATGLDPHHLAIETRVNGALRQAANTSDLLFDIPYLVSYLSQAVTLLPGDVILTGTPSGVGPLAPGDVCDITIEGIGTLSNPVVAEVA